MAKKKQQTDSPPAEVTKGVKKSGPREQLASLIAARSGRGYFPALDASKVLSDEEVATLLETCSDAKGEAVYLFDGAIAAKNAEAAAAAAPKQ